MTNCTDCSKTYQAYLCDVPSKWRDQISDLMCKVVQDVNVITCEKVTECETVTSLSPFSLVGDTLSITYTDERGVSVTRSIEIPNFGGDFIQNQFTSAQTAEFWVSGRTSVGNIDITDDTLPSNGLRVPTANTLGLVAGGVEVTKILGTTGLMTHSGNIFLDAVISAQPGISFFLNSFADSDYFVQRRGTTIDMHGAGISMLSANVDTSFTVNANSNRGFEMQTGGSNLLQMFTDGCLHIETTAIQQLTDPCAILKLVSTTRGFLNVNVTTAQKMAIASPKPGLMVFDTDLQKMCVYTTIWETMTSA